MEFVFKGLIKIFLILLFAVAGVAYILSPIDLIPDVIPVLGWCDDLGVAGFVVKYIIKKVTKHIALWVIIIPGACCLLLWNVHTHLAIAAGSIAFSFGLWKIGKEFDD